MAFKQYRGNSTFEVWLIKRRSGEWEHKAYRLKPGSGEREGTLPAKLEKKLVGRVKCRFPIDAVRAAISRHFGDDSDQAAEEMAEPAKEA